MSSYSPGIPSSFDPALLFSEYDLIPNAPSSLSYSDDLEAIQQCIDETVAKNAREGTVIQYRAWPLAHAFRSEGDVSIGTLYAPLCLPLN